MNRVPLAGKVFASLMASVVMPAAAFAQPADAVAAEQPAPVEAASQAAEPAVPSGEIIVTARRRAETAFETPVVLQAISAEDISRRSITNIEGLSRVTPLLIIGENAGAIQGAPLGIRGVSGSDINPLADQPISFFVDGVQISRSTVARLGIMDLANAEVLKGPQALFYGRNSPGGVISLRSADPTADFQASLSAGYEFNADETRLEGFISAPLTGNLGIRFAGYYSNMEGYLRNDARPGPGSVASFTRSRNGYEAAGRLTLLWEPSPDFTARFKLAYGYADDTGHSSLVQVVRCAGAIPQSSSTNSNCLADGQTSLIDPGPSFQAVFPTRRGGNLYGIREQVLSSLELNWDITEDINLSSTTGYYRYDTDSLVNISGIDNQAVYFALPEAATYQDVSQELRLLSTFDGLFNFAAGVTYFDSRVDYFNNFHLTAGGRFIPFHDAELYQRGRAWSVYGQLIFTPTDTIEISAGGRYSEELKRLRTFSFNVEQFSARPQLAFDDFSPEVTARWRITPDINLFASYRSGFLSGGFNGNGSPSYTGRDLGYDQQKTEGFEAGIRARLFDNLVRASLSAFTYNLTGLQVAVNQGTVVIQTNAGRAHSDGVEADLTINPAPGLYLRGAISYNDARYDEFVFACWRGQSRGEGCNLNPVNGVPTGQSLAGQQIVRAPEWGGAAGISYDTTLGGFRLATSVDANYSDSYFNNATNSPQMIQDAYWTVDSSIRFGDPDQNWEIALLGRNLTNEYFVARASEQPNTGQPSGGVLPGIRADTQGVVGRGREIMLRLTIRSGLFQ